jgi:hypothetical protein
MTNLIGRRKLIGLLGSAAATWPAAACAQQPAKTIKRNARHTIKNAGLTLAMLIVFGVALNLLAVSDGQAQLFLGCFKDQADRDLDGLLAHSDNLTAAQCVATCRSGGFRYDRDDLRLRVRCRRSSCRAGR